MSLYGSKDVKVKGVLKLELFFTPFMQRTGKMNKILQPQYSDILLVLRSLCHQPKVFQVLFQFCLFIQGIIKLLADKVATAGSPALSRLTFSGGLNLEWQVTIRVTESFSWPKWKVKTYYRIVDLEEWSN